MKKIKFLLKLKIRILFFILFLSGNITAQPDTLSFLHITDTHIIFNIDFYHPGIADGRIHYSRGIEPLKFFLFTSSEKMNCDFITITGDMIDFFEAEISDEKMLDFQVEQFSRLIDGSFVPVFATLGNHDIAAYSWTDGERGSTQDIAERAKAGWIRNVRCFKNGTYYSRVYEVGDKIYRLIFLDDGFNNFQPEENVEVPFIYKPQIHWLEAQLQQSADDIEIIFMHIPIVPANSSEEPSCELYSVLAKYPSCRMVLAGHNHKNAIRDFYSPQNNRITQVQTDAFGRSADNWRMIHLTENNIMVSFPGKMDSELEISVK